MSNFWIDAHETIIAIYETVIEEVNNALETLRDTWPMLLFLVFTLIGLFAISNPPPPKKIIMATGPVGSSYELMAKKYAAILEKKGIALVLHPTTGTGENSRLIVDPSVSVDIAFVAAGLINPDDAKGIVSLGSIEYSPLWLFYRSGVAGATDQSIRELLGKRVSIGPIGSATDHFALQLLKLNQVTKPDGFVNMSHADALMALERGDLDGLFVVDAMESPSVQRLISNHTLRLANFVRANAYTRVLPYLEKLQIDEGSLDLARDFPKQQTEILATTIALVAKEHMHPALQMLMLEAAKEINGKETFFTQRGEFPSFKDPHLPESEEARIYYEKGPPLLMRYLPFWVAEFIHRMVFILLPFAIVAYPVILSLPGYRLKRIKARITLVYGDLKILEQDIVKSQNFDDLDQYLLRLEDIESRATGLKVPKSVASDYFSLLTTIDFVRGMLIRLKKTQD